MEEMATPASPDAQNGASWAFREGEGREMRERGRDWWSRRHVTRGGRFQLESLKRRTGVIKYHREKKKKNKGDKDENGHKEKDRMKGNEKKKKKKKRE